MMPLSHYRHQRVLITGGSGYLGQSLCRQLLALGTKVTVADIIKPIFPVDFQRLSITNYQSVTKIIKRRFDIIFHLAAISGVINHNPRFTAQVNIIGTLNLLESLRLFSPQSIIVFSNSRQEYGQVNHLPVDEHQVTLPLNHYGVEKLTTSHYARLYHQLYGLKTIVLRTANIYGNYHQDISSNYNIINQWISRAKKQKPIIVFGQGKQKRDYLYIDDFIQALLSAAIAPKAIGQIINLGSGKGLSLKHMAKIITHHLDGRIVFQSWPQEWLKVETGSYVTNIAKAKKILHWQPMTSFSQGIKKIARL